MKEQEGKIVKKIAKKNQIVIATLAVMIAAAGYMNYSGKLFPGKTKTQETNSELANKELLDMKIHLYHLGILKVRMEILAAQTVMPAVQMTAV